MRQKGAKRRHRQVPHMYMDVRIIYKSVLVYKSSDLRINIRVG